MPLHLNTILVSENSLLGYKFISLKVTIYQGSDVLAQNNLPGTAGAEIPKLGLTGMRPAPGLTAVLASLHGDNTKCLVSGPISRGSGADAVTRGRDRSQDMFANHDETFSFGQRCQPRAAQWN